MRKLRAESPLAQGHKASSGENHLLFLPFSSLLSRESSRLVGGGGEGEGKGERDC